MRFPVLFGYFVLTAMTAVYSVLIWYAGNLFSVFLSTQAASRLPLITQLSIIPLPLPLWWNMVHWQALSVVSLVICISWGVKRVKWGDSDTEHALPMVIHTGWIVFAICCHMLGALMPMLMIGHILE